MDLSEFLQTANADDAIALSEAKAHQETKGNLIHRDTMNSLLAQAKLYVAFKDMAADINNPFQDELTAFLDSQDFNFMQDSPTGIAQIAMLDTIIDAGVVGLSDAITALKPTIIGLANKVHFPFANNTLADVKRIRKSVTYAELSDQNGWLKITTSADCEKHNPQIFAETQGVRHRVAGFNGVEAAGEYLSQVPRGYASLFVENPYGVIS